MKMGSSSQIVACLAVLAITSYVAYATDPSQLQDFCVGLDNPLDGVFVNGKFCKDPKKVSADDFLFRGLNVPGNTDNIDGTNVTKVDINTLPGLNTLGVSLARIDMASYGLETPHYHPRATKVVTVLKGTMYVGFVSSNQPDGSNILFSKVLEEGDVFIFPQGLVHFAFNPKKEPVVAIYSYSSQNPGVVTIPNSVFGTTPPISVEVLSKAFQLDPKIVKDLQTKFTG